VLAPGMAGLPRLLQDDVRMAVLGEAVAERKPGLSSADDHGPDVLRHERCSLPARCLLLRAGWRWARR
jgi:hypothetical protein